MEIYTEINIKATPEKVWGILTDFNNYSAWNPLVKSLNGEVKVGNKIKVVLESMTFKPTVLSFEINKEFTWIGHLLFPGVFDGNHIFKLIDNGDGSTKLVHAEKFKGILVGLLKNKLERETKPSFILMNEKLKEMAEK